jgi:hypothetical protein
VIGMRTYVFFVILLAMAFGCGDDGSAPADAAAGRDATRRADGGGGVSDANTSDDAGGSGTDSGVPGADAGAVSGDVVGWWVWKETHDGDTVEEITEADMEWMVGSSGWPGCPDGISCTRTGIMVVGFSSEGRAHVMHRVTTGSDTQHPATYTLEGDLLRYHRTDRFSCAHPPGGSTDDAGDFYARWRRDGDDLWLSVTRFGGLPFANEEPAAEPTQWIVFRPITREEAHGRYDHPYCGAARKGVESCHPLCASTDVLADATSM